MLSFVKERIHAFLLIAAFEASAEKLRFEIDRLVHVQVKTFVDRLLAVSDSDRSILRDLASQLLRSNARQITQRATAF